MTPRITLNYGLRWDCYGWSRKRTICSLISFPLRRPREIWSRWSRRCLGLYQPDKTNFSPRVGIAWDLTGKGTSTVIRAGYGLFFDAFSQDMLFGHLPYPTFYAPGPAYNTIGPDPVQMANANPAAFGVNTDPNRNGVYLPGRADLRNPGLFTLSAIFSLLTAT